jgi:hypothetical protein
MQGDQKRLCQKSPKMYVCSPAHFWSKIIFNISLAKKSHKTFKTTTQSHQLYLNYPNPVTSGYMYLHIIEDLLGKFESPRLNCWTVWCQQNFHSCWWKLLSQQKKWLTLAVEPRRTSEVRWHGCFRHSAIQCQNASQHTFAIPRNQGRIINPKFF